MVSVSESARLVFAVLLGSLLAGLCPASETPVRVERLLCEQQAAPLGVEQAQPRLSWVLSSKARDVVQSAYQVLVASSSDALKRDDADLWNSGKTDSSEQSALYAGESLPPASQAFWKVRIWDGPGRPSPWSEPAQWLTGLRGPDDWHAQWVVGQQPPAPAFTRARWIWSPDVDLTGAEPAAPPGHRRFRKAFSLPDGASVRAAELIVAADNEFVAYVNGARIGAGRSWEHAQRFHVTGDLKSGENVLAVAVLNGADAPNPAGLIAELGITLSDGKTMEVVTDGEWRCTAEHPPGWRAAGFDETACEPAVDLGPYGMAPWGKKTVQGRLTPLPLFRKTFSVQDKPLRHAIVYVCGLGHFELSLNGVKMGDHFLDPGWTNYRKTCLYVPFDISGAVKPGDNTFGVMLGNGLYNVPGGRYVKFTGSFGEPKLILEARIVYEDGTSERVVSDATWKTSPGPIVFSCMYGGEDYDARLEQPGWDAPDFDDGTWDGATVVEGPGGALRAQTAPPVKVIRHVPAVGTTRLGPGRYEVDLGENLSARPVITARGERGRSFTVTVAERKGHPWGGHSYRYTFRGEDVEILRPRFTYFGFQYLYIDGLDWGVDAQGERPVLLEAGADFVSSSAEPVGSFQCTPPLLAEIDAMVDRSVRSNLQSVLTDCPHREKLGWLEVSHLMGPSILYRYDAYGLYAKICRDTTESQLENGLVPDIAPEFTRFNGGFFESAEWGSACVQNPWLLYRWYGHTGILARQYATMARYTRYLATTRNDKGLAKGGLGDWYDWTPERGHAGPAQLTPAELTATCMLYANARIMAQTAALFLREDDEREFTHLGNEVRKDFMAAYYDPGTHSVATGSQSSLAMALHFGLAPEEDRAAVFENLLYRIEQDKFRQTTGEVCFRYLLLALAEGGRSDIIYRMMTRPDAPGYVWMMREYGLKTLSERWDRPGSSLNHCMFGHIQEWFSAYVLGIRRAGPAVGFRQLRIAPTPVGDLMSAKGHFDSPQGRIEVAWEKDEERFTLGVLIPPNTTASVALPVPEDSTVRESGRTVELREIDGRPTAVVGSGRYRFECRRLKAQ